jgi:hypothetical protein
MDPATPHVKGSLRDAGTFGEGEDILAPISGIRPSSV